MPPLEQPFADPSERGIFGLYVAIHLISDPSSRIIWFDRCEELCSASGVSSVTNSEDRTSAIEEAVAVNERFLEGLRPGTSRAGGSVQGHS